MLDAFLIDKIRSGNDSSHTQKPLALPVRPSLQAPRSSAEEDEPAVQSDHDPTVVDFTI